MFVRLMTSDDWRDRADQGITVGDPTWDRVKEAIVALDGKEKTMVTLSDRQDSDSYIIIAGQWNGRFLVNATKDNHDFYSLIDPARSTAKQTLFVGGQDGEYEERKGVPLAWALEAARVFFETGELKSSMNWISDH